MNRAGELLERLARGGGIVTRRGDDLVVKAGRNPISRGLIFELRSQRAEILNLLSAYEHGGEGPPRDVPHQWSEGLARLKNAAPIEGISLFDWLQLVADARLFLDEWGYRAARLGWSAEDVFGVHPGAPAARYDAMGLVALLRGQRVTAITADRATIGTLSGGALTYYRHRRADESVSIWQLIQ